MIYSRVFMLPYKLNVFPLKQNQVLAYTSPATTSKRYKYFIFMEVGCLQLNTTLTAQEKSLKNAP